MKLTNNNNIYNIKSKRRGHDGYVPNNIVDSKGITDVDNLEWCEFCAHYGYVSVYRTCAQANTLEILRDGPLGISFYGRCKHFVNRYSPAGKKIQYSKLKQKLLEHYGFKKEK